MATIAENLQKLIDLKAVIKEALNNQGKEPSDKLEDYAGLINDLENPEKVVYFVTLDGETETIANIYNEEKVELTATANDIRKGTVAITNDGVIEGEKVIPAYHTTTATRVIPANTEFKLYLPDEDKYDYTKFQAMIMTWNTSISDSVSVNKTVIDNNVYAVGSTEIISTISKDDATKSILLGIINGDTPAVIRYFTYKEVP